MTATENIRHLIMEIDVEIEHLQQLENDLSKIVSRFSRQDQVSIHDMRGIAMLLTEIYLGAENLMRRVAKNLAEPIPSGKAWHKELLNNFHVKFWTLDQLYSVKIQLVNWMNFAASGTSFTTCTRLTTTGNR
jgi:hypothetical protein